MNAKTLLVAGLLALVAVGVWIAPGGPATRAADPPRATAEVGRYHLVHDPNGRVVHLFDTATGRVWEPSFPQQVGEWREHIAPPKAK